MRAQVCAPLGIRSEFPDPSVKFAEYDKPVPGTHRSTKTLTTDVDSCSRDTKARAEPAAAHVEAYTVKKLKRLTESQPHFVFLKGVVLILSAIFDRGHLNSSNYLHVFHAAPYGHLLRRLVLQKDALTLEELEPDARCSYIARTVVPDPRGLLRHAEIRSPRQQSIGDQGWIPSRLPAGASTRKGEGVLNARATRPRSAAALVGLTMCGRAQTRRPRTALRSRDKPRF